MNATLTCAHKYVFIERRFLYQHFVILFQGQQLLLNSYKFCLKFPNNKFYLCIHDFLFIQYTQMCCICVYIVLHLYPLRFYLLMLFSVYDMGWEHMNIMTYTPKSKINFVEVNRSIHPLLHGF